MTTTNPIRASVYSVCSAGGAGMYPTGILFNALQFNNETATVLPSATSVPSIPLGSSPIATSMPTAPVPAGAASVVCTVPPPVPITSTSESTVSGKRPPFYDMCIKTGIVESYDIKTGTGWIVSSHVSGNKAMVNKSQILGDGFRRLVPGMLVEFVPYTTEESGVTEAKFVTGSGNQPIPPPGPEEEKPLQKLQLVTPPVTPPVASSMALASVFATAAHALSMHEKGSPTVALSSSVQNTSHNAPTIRAFVPKRGNRYGPRYTRESLPKGRHTGIVIKTKGHYAFVKPDDGSADLYVGVKNVVLHQRVEFEFGYNHVGPTGEKVKILDSLLVQQGAQGAQQGEQQSAQTKSSECESKTKVEAKQEHKQTRRSRSRSPRSPRSNRLRSRSRSRGHRSRSRSRSRSPSARRNDRDRVSLGEKSQQAKTVAPSHLVTTASHPVTAASPLATVASLLKPDSVKLDPVKTMSMSTAAPLNTAAPMSAAAPMTAAVPMTMGYLQMGSLPMAYATGYPTGYPTMSFLSNSASLPFPLWSYLPAAAQHAQLVQLNALAPGLAVPNMLPLATPFATTSLKN